MTRSKRDSKALEKADIRLAGMKSIDPNLDFGNGLSLTQYSIMVEDLRRKHDAYNATLATLDQALKEIRLAEEGVNDMSEHMLLAVAAIYGKGSNEYAIAGGTRKTKRTTIRNMSARTAPPIMVSAVEGTIDRAIALNGSSASNNSKN